MKQFMIRRVLPMVLTISILLPSLVVPSVAASFPNEYIDKVSVYEWEQAITRPNTDIVSALVNALGGGSDATNRLFWSCVNQTVTDYGEVSMDTLDRICNSYNRFFNYDPQYTVLGSMLDFNDAFTNTCLAQWFGLGKVNFVVDEHPSSGLLRIKDTRTGLWVVNEGGLYPYVDPTLKESSGGDYWETTANVYKNVIRGEGPGGHFTSKGSLESTKDYLVQRGFNCWIAEIGGSGMMGITKSGYFLCDSEGRPYFCWEQDYQAVVNQDRPTSEIVTESGEQVEVPEDMEVELDIENNFVLLPTGDTAIIGEVIYDASEKIYHVETHKVKNYTDIDYETTVNNYTYEYYVQNTTVTYIGETMDYEKYECYYKLPDGRSSADLTKEELEQLNVGIDVVEYSRSTDDVRLRALYHFDGDTKDSSYWNHLSEFHWSNAPSITYMDVETFGGALYLDGNVRSTMHFDLPTALGSGDFTIQFRYFQGQSLSEDTYTGLYLNASSEDSEWWPSRDDTDLPVLRFNGEAFSFADLDDGEFHGQGESYPVGSWFEVCLTREGDTFTYFLNGVPLIVTDEYADMSFNDRITYFFYGGSGRIEYVMFDELRVLNYAIASGTGSYYEPTAVPHDTNLALVLPEDKIAIADEYWTFESSKENLLEQYGLADWQGFGYKDMSPYLKSLDTEFVLDSNDYLTAVYFNSPSWPFMFYHSSVLELSSGSSGLVLERIQSDELVGNSYLGGLFISNGVPFSCLVLPLLGLSDGTYTFSAYLSSGSLLSFSFSVSNGLADSFYSVSDQSFCLVIDSRFPYLLLSGIDPDIVTELLYLELVEGDSTDLTATYNGEIAVVDKDDQFKPTLAVKTDLEITDYQIGGVRPSIPSKGLVYAMVESGYITSLQIYNGQAWEACDGRIWTGQRWIPYSSYNVITLQDMYDVVDATPGYEYIYSEAGFWAWWQKSWNEFKEQLFSVLNNIAGIVGEDSGLDDPILIVDPDEEGGLGLLAFIVLLINGGKSVIKGVRNLFSGAVSSVPDAVETITGAFSEGGVAVGLIDGTYRDPDMEVVAVMDLDSLDYYETEEVLDPWRYR